ncbi:MAG: oligopeptide/dipeptide ABC transporter ATP-binding protein [Egibacteraceae bacterium]
MSLLQVEDFSLYFVQYEAGLRRRRLDVITALDLSVDAGELVAVVGASGSGKSLLAHALLGVLPSNAVEGGKVTFDGAPLDHARRRALRGREIALIPQSVTFLDPLARAGAQVRRAATLTGAADPGAAAGAALRRLDLGDQAAARYPHELSGGMVRRVLTAAATIGAPRLVLADEPTPGLHPAAVTRTLRGLRDMADRSAGVVLITHDLLRALDVADRVAVFYAGTTVETAPATAFAGDGENLAHPYTRALWRALPQHGFIPLPGAQPPPTDVPPGCVFADRCPLVTDECRVGRPQARQVGSSIVRCIRAGEASHA